MTEPTKEELLIPPPGSVNTEALGFKGLRGDPGRHLDRASLTAAIFALPAPPRDLGTVDLLVARGPEGERHLPAEALLVEAGSVKLGDAVAVVERRKALA